MDVKSFIKQNLVKKFITPSITRVCVCVCGIIGFF